MKKFYTSQSDLVKYNDLGCTVLRELNSKEYDQGQGYTMYEIQLENGKRLHVFNDEIVG